jgi:hypothetical protein
VTLQRLTCLLLGHHWEIRRRYALLYAELVKDDPTEWYERCSRCGKEAAVDSQTRKEQSK